MASDYCIDSIALDRHTDCKVSTCNFIKYFRFSQGRTKWEGGKAKEDKPCDVNFRSQRSL